MTVSVNINFEVDQKNVGEKSFQTKTFFNPLAWETELIWQVAQMISHHHQDVDVAIETLDEILQKLKKNKQSS